LLETIYLLFSRTVADETTATQAAAAAAAAAAVAAAAMSRGAAFDRGELVRLKRENEEYRVRTKKCFAFPFNFAFLRARCIMYV
jgi:hypothetical protein